MPNLEPSLSWSLATLSASTRVQLSPFLPELWEEARWHLLLLKLGVQVANILTGQDFTLANMNTGVTRRIILFKQLSSQILFLSCCPIR